MIEMHAKLAAQLMGGTLVGPNSLFRGVSTDTRLLQPGELFFALKGENFDAHAFLDQAVDKGAAGLVTEDDFETTIDCIRVASCEQALADLASDWRNRFEMPLVAITGSNGKTTVKEMVTAILSEQGEVSSTKGNLNNHIGVPLTLLRLSSNHDFAVTELGANHVGEIRSLSQLAKPTVGVVTQCAPAHLEGFGSIDDVAKAKGELFEYLGTGSTAVINADDHYAPLWHELAKPATCLTFGLKSAADVSATWVGDGASTRIVLLLSLIHI